MNWLDGLETYLAAHPLLSVAAIVLFWLVVFVMVCGMYAVPLWPFRRKTVNPDWQATQPADIQWSTPTMRRVPLAIREAEPPVIKNLGKTPLYVEMDGRTRVVPPMPAMQTDCCGKCDGSRCGDKPAPSASTMTPQELRTALARTAAASSRRTTGQTPPRRNPGHVPPRSWPAPASSASTTRRREDSSSSDTPIFSGSWAAPSPDTCRAPAPSPSYDSGSYSSSSSSDCGGGDSGGGGGGGD